MKALSYTGPNQLAVKERNIPEIQAGEVLIKVAYAGICGTDMLAFHGGMDNRVKPPVIFGHEFSGTIEQAHEGSLLLKGDRVTVEPLITCGECHGCQTGEYNLCTSLNLIGIDSDGAMADFIKVPELNVYKLGEQMSMEAGALIEPLAVCVHLIKKGNITTGQTVLIVGGGPIGLITALAAKLKGAHVIISEINPFRIGVAQKYGFDVIKGDQNFLEQINEKTNRRGADVSIEATGTNIGLVSCIEGTGIKGTVVIAGLPKKKADFDIYRIIAKELTLVGTRVYNRDDYLEAIEMINAEKIDLEPLISRVVSLGKAIEQGFAAIDEGEDIIKVLISLNQKDEEK
ncbi:zinc-dependent alcohol dehydrogenase [Mesobacillus harenae]|uniref:zinc-dependent alcohol dehydrogenase n=1 Tax=Mesobacillus harenae TaxID=2213203 RepID=UPI001580242B|nr:alcohol dehydrogenase catalytic domain-containing protein [Mesobacillus harenae]